MQQERYEINTNKKKSCLVLKLSLSLSNSRFVTLAGKETNDRLHGASAIQTPRDYATGARPESKRGARAESANGFAQPEAQE